MSRFVSAFFLLQLANPSGLVSFNSGTLLTLVMALAVMPMVVACFFAYWIFVRHELMALDIVIYIAAMVGAIHLALRWSANRFIQKWWPLWLVLIAAVIVLTGVLTYHAPDWIIFEDMG